MKIKREGGREGSLVELGEKRVRVADRQFKIKLFARKT